MLRTRALVFLTILLTLQKVFSQNCSAEWSVTAELLVSWDDTGLDADVTVHVSASQLPPITCLLSAEKTVRFSEGQIEFNSTVGLCPNSQYDVTVFLNCTDGDWADETIVWTKPDAPEDLTVHIAPISTLVAEWTPPYGPIDRYVVSLNDIGENTSETQYTFRDLEYNATYAVRVLACHQKLCGPSTNSFIAPTLIGLPPPPIIQPITASNTSAWIQWEEPEPFVDLVLEYEFRWRTKEDMWMNSTVVYNNSHVIYDLLPYTWFDVAVRATTQEGTGNWSFDTFRTEAGIPNEPRYLNISEITSTSISIEWEDPEPPQGLITLFEILWGEWNGTWLEHNENTTTERFFTLGGLQPFSNYSIKVRGKTFAGFGAWSEERIAETCEDVPNEPRDLKAVEVTNTIIWIEWMDPDPPNGNILSYVVRWKIVDDRVFSSQENSTLDSSFVLDGLQPYSNYSIQVRGETAAGLGPWSKELIVETEIGVPHPPWDLQATDISNSSILLNWKEDNVSTGPVIGYLVSWSIIDDPISTKEFSTGNLFYLIENLLPYTSYAIKVRARTAAGFGDWSAALLVETLIGFPLPPVHLSATSSTNTSLTLEWLDAKPSHGPIRDYSLGWGRTGESGRRFVDDIVDRTYTLFDLDPYTNYSIRVRARTHAGYGNWTTEETFQTEIGIPSEPLNVTLVLSTNTSLKFEWQEPAKPNGPLLPYEIRWYKLNDESSSKIHECNDRFYECPDLLPYTFYSIRVAARTSAGRGEWSPTLVVQTEVGIPSPALFDVIEVEDSRTIIVTWKVQGTFPGPTEYELQVWKNLGPCLDKIRVVIAKNVDGRVDWILGKHRTRVGDLVPYTKYYFKVVLKTTAGQRESEYSDNVRTKPDVPGSPQEVIADCDSSPTEARVCWKPPKEPNGEIYEYVLEYAYQDVVRSVQIQVDNVCSDQSVLLTDLRPERSYTISVKTKVKDVVRSSPAAFWKQKCELPAGVPPVSEASLLKVKSGDGTESLFIEWSQDTFSDRLGAILKYAILVGTPEAVGNLSSSGQEVDDVLVPTWKNFTDGFSDFYQATPVEWNPFEHRTEAEDPLKCEVLDVEEWPNQNITVLRCGVGLQEDCSGYETYCNGPLKPDTSYAMKIRASTRGGYADTHLLLAKTASYPKPSMRAGIIVGIIVCLLILTFMAGIFTYRKKVRMDPFLKAFESRFGNHTEVDAPLSLNLQQYQTKGPVSVDKFPEHVRLMMSDSHLKFSQEFEKLKRESPQLPCNVAEMEENRPKNRWMNIFPFDHSRVKLLPLGDEPGSDFINANYIPGASSLREYIATQGPLATTVDDFWRMIWEQSVTTIVMLTQCVERGKSKCEEYWPPSTQGGAHYGDLLVRTVSESMLDSYVIRIFQVQLGSRERQVKQLHFTRWPDFGCPESPEELVNFVTAVRDHLPRTVPGPIIVHCSAGVGRTGTFIAVDRLTQELKSANQIDVYGTVLQLRHHRTNMVQTEDQYIYIHLCVQQLVLERRNPKGDQYEGVIYSNIGSSVTGV